jgi:mono/diheme cytochrome c family protein
MKTKWTVAFSFVTGILFTLLVPMVLLATGAINMGADIKPGLIERTIGPWARDRAVEKRAPNEKNPFAGDSTALATGLDHYRANCVMCHGAPDVAAAELSKGINPSAPSLGKEQSDTSDGELFWVVKHGIRTTAMPAFGPTHTDEEIWKVVAFIRHLPDLTARERNSLRAATGEEAHHHGVESRVPPVK